MRMVKITTLSLAFALLASCVSNGRRDTLSTTERQLSFPPGYYNHLVYLDGRVLAFADDSVAPKGKQISYAFEGDEKTTLFRPEGDPNCMRFVQYEVVTLLPDDRLGLFKECNRAAGMSSTRTMLAYDWKQNRLDPLVDVNIPLFGPKFFTWNPEMTLGIQETSGSYRGTIYWITPNGFQPMDVQIEARGLTWNLKDYLEGEERTGFVRHPSWSPDGETIAFFASTYGILEEPKPKFNVGYDLFFMHPSTLEPKLELRDVADAGRIDWSPDNSHLLFRGCVGQNAICGLWRYSIHDKHLALVKEGEFADYVWITSERIVVAKNIDLPYEDNEIWEYSFSNQ